MTRRSRQSRHPNGGATPRRGDRRPAGGAKPESAKGEAKVWLTAMGLTVGMAMVFGLLLLVLVRGVSVHWPARVAQFTLKEGAESPLSGKTSFAGEVVLRQQRSTAAARSIQLHIGNKDLFGQNYVWVQATDIAASTQPEGILMLERMEYGDAIWLADGTALQGRDADSPPATPLFATGSIARRRGVQAPRTNRKHRERRDRRASTGGCSKSKIRATAGARVSEEESGLCRLNMKNSPPEPPNCAPPRRKFSSSTATVCGEEKVLPVGNIVHFYYPNRLGFADRFGVFCHQFWAFLSADPREANTEGGIWPAIFGTFVMTVLMSLSSLRWASSPPFIFANMPDRGRSFARSAFRSTIWPAFPRLSSGSSASASSCIWSASKSTRPFSARTQCRHKTFGTGGILWASLTLALLTLPVVIVATEEALAAVPRGVREAALACGAIEVADDPARRPAERRARRAHRSHPRHGPRRWRGGAAHAHRRGQTGACHCPSTACSRSFTPTENSCTSASTSTTWDSNRRTPKPPNRWSSPPRCC